MASLDEPSPALSALRSLCCVLKDRHGFQGVAVSLISGRGPAGVVAASDDHSRRLAELQFSAGEGPCYDAVRLSRPVLTPDLDKEVGRWPGFASTAIEAGVSGIFAFPLQVGALCLGVLDVYAARAGSLTDEQARAALTCVRRATEVLLDGAPGVGNQIDNRAEIYQAQGMVMAARGIDAADALAHMRAQAFARHQALLALALEILAGRHLREDE